jgi:hypothetical protein
MFIKIKPEIVSQSNGFDFSPTGNPYAFPIDRNSAENKIRQVIRSSYSVHRDCGFFYHMQKFRGQSLIQQTLTRGGKPSKKAPTVIKIPTHWSYTVYAVPSVVIEMLRRSGKVIVQQKHHWEIVDSSKKREIFSV